MAAIFAFGHSAEPYKITSSGTLIYTKECFSFQILEEWKAISGNSVPLLYNFAPGSAPVSLQDIPIGAASLAIGPENYSKDHSNSITDLIRISGRAHSLTSIGEMRYSKVTGITRAVKVHWTEVDPGLPRLETDAVFFTYRGQVFTAYLNYYRSDKRANLYATALAGVFSSFRPLVNYQGCDAPK